MLGPEIEVLDASKVAELKEVNLAGVGVVM